MPPPIHKNEYEGMAFRGQTGPRDTVCGQTVDAKQTTDDWERVNCPTCQRDGHVHMFDGRDYSHWVRGYTLCAVRIAKGNITKDWSAVTCKKCLASRKK